jgi:hypothetical protein
VLSTPKLVVIFAIGAFITVALLWQRSDSPPPPINDGVKSAVTGASNTGSAPGLAQNPQSYRNKATIPQSTQWRKMQMTKEELQAFRNYWMLAYSESDMAWLDRHGYPSLEEEEKLSKASIEQLKALAAGGDLNAGIHLGLRHSKSALMSGDAAEFRAARRELSRALIEGGPYQSAKTVAFFAELANDRRSYGDLSATTLKELETQLIPYHQIARGMVSLYGDTAAERVGNGASRDLERVFGLPAQNQMSFEMAMRMFSNINATRMQSGLPAFPLEQRPSSPGTFQFHANNVVYSR